jgi:hypothetical protein
MKFAKPLKKRLAELVVVESVLSTVYEVVVPFKLTSTHVASNMDLNVLFFVKYIYIYPQSNEIKKEEETERESGEKASLSLLNANESQLASSSSTRLGGRSRNRPAI